MTENSGQLELLDQSRLRTAAWTARVAGMVTAGFCALVCLVLVVSFLRNRSTDLLTTDELTHMKAELATRPTDDAMKLRIRAADQKLRTLYFERKALWKHGAWMLLAGTILGLGAIKLSLTWEEKARLATAGGMASPPAPPNPWRQNAAARWGVGLGTVYVVMALAYWGVVSGSVPKVGPDAPVATVVQAPPATVEQYKANWPFFRGFDGNAIVAPGDWPTTWDGASGKNVLWKTPVPLHGNSSPIVWEKFVFVTGATASKREVYCLDAETGKILWTAPVGQQTGPKVFDDTGHAAPTMATDGRRVFAIFSTGEMACLDFAGKQLWEQPLPKPDTQYGYSASLLVWRDRVIIQYDHGTTADEKKSYLIALDAATGRQIWKKQRPVPNSWSSPVIGNAPGGQAQIVTTGQPWVIAYDPQSGDEKWKVSILEGDIGPSPIVVNGIVYAVNVGSKLAAIKMDGSGDVAATHVLWAGEDGLPDTVSPLSDGSLVWIVGPTGVLTCYDAKTGKSVYDKELNKAFYSSPTLVGQTIHLTERTGVTHMLSAGREFKEIGTAALGEAVDASPAFVGGRMYMRGRSNLYCIGR